MIINDEILIYGSVLYKPNQVTTLVGLSFPNLNFK